MKLIFAAAVCMLSLCLPACEAESAHAAAAAETPRIELNNSIDNDLRDPVAVTYTWSRGNDDPWDPQRETARIKTTVVCSPSEVDQWVVDFEWEAINTPGVTTFARVGPRYVLREHRSALGEKDRVSRLELQGEGTEQTLRANSELGLLTPSDDHITAHLSIEYLDYAASRRRLVQQLLTVEATLDNNGEPRFRVQLRQLNPGVTLGGRVPTPIRLVSVDATTNLLEETLGEFAEPYGTFPNWHSAASAQWRSGTPPANRTPLMNAIIERDLAQVAELLQGDVDVDARDDAGNCPLEFAFEAGLPELMVELVEHHGAYDVTGLIADPLGRAALLGDESAARELLDSGARPDGLRWQPGLHTSEGHDAVKRGLLREGNALTPLIAACRLGHEGIVHALLDAGAEPDVGVEYVGTALFPAVVHGHHACARALVDAGAPTRYAHMMSATIGDIEMLEVLLPVDADIDVREPDTGETALMLAARHGQRKSLDYLIDRGADKTLRDSWGFTARDHAEFGGHWDMVETYFKE